MEQRAHVRQAVEMPAWISSGNLEDQPCELKDFCLGGVLLGLPAEDNALMQALENGDALSLAVEVEGVRGTRTLRLPGRIVRREPGALGVAFVEPDPTDLLAMQNQVRRLLDQAEPRAVTSGPRDAQRGRQAARGVLRVLHHFCVSGMEEFFVTARDKLEGGKGDASAVLDALRSNRSALTRDFIARASRPLENIAEGSASQDEARGMTTPDSPDDSGAFQEWLALRVMASRTELRFNQELLSLQLRFDELFDISLNPRRNPLAPSVLCTAFGEALAGLDLPEGTDQQALLDAFEQTLLAGLGDFYETINKALSRAGVLSDLDVSRYINENYPSPNSSGQG